MGAVTYDRGMVSGELTPDERSQAWVLFQAMHVFVTGHPMDAASYAQHPHLKLRDLSAERQRLIGEYVRRMVEEGARRRSTATFSELYLATLERFGVDCPHVPLMESRYYEDPRCVLECRHCGTVECVDDPQKNPRMLMIARSLRWIGHPTQTWDSYQIPTRAPSA